jgi:serralysin
VTVAVLANDSDVDGDALLVSGVTQPANGTVTINAGSGTLLYTPKNNWIGSETFSYSVADGKGGTATATVTVTVASSIVGNDAANTLTGTMGKDDIDARGGNDVVDARGGDDYVSGGDGDDDITGGAGADVLFGDAGNDEFFVTGSDLNGDAIDGGIGTDTLVFTGNVTLTEGFAITGVEQLNTNGKTLTVKTTAAVDLSAMTAAGTTSVLGDATANTITGSQSADTINGGDGNDTLGGAGGNDTIYGGTGADVIAGGLGNDVLFGNTDKKADAIGDTFVFNTALNATTNVDTIGRFEASALDKIALDPTVFASLTGGATAGVDASEFRVSAGGNAVDADDFLLYDTATGSLYYDADGSGAGAKLLFARLTGLVGTLDSSDFTTALPGGV